MLANVIERVAHRRRSGAAAEEGSTCASHDRPRALLLCGVGTGNIGNDASLQTVVAMLASTRPDLELLVATPFVAGATELLDLPVVPIRQDLSVHRSLGSPVAVVRAIVLTEARRLASAARLLRDAEFVVVTGTGIFDDFGEHPWNMPYALLVWTLLARLTKRPFAFLAVGAGPVVHPLSRLQFRWAARLASTVSYRDSGSRDFMDGLGAGRVDATVVPDLVFGHEVPSAPPAAPTASTLTVGLGVMAYGGWSSLGEGPVYQAYLACLVEVADSVLAAGHSLVLLVGQPCDRPVVDDLRARLRPEHRARAVVPGIDDFADLLGAVGATDVVVATRYHNIVAALMMNRPVVSLSYAPKNAALLRDLGVVGFDRPIEEATPPWVLDRLREIHSGQGPFVDQVWQSVDQCAAHVRREVARVATMGAAGRRGDGRGSSS